MISQRASNIIINWSIEFAPTLIYFAMLAVVGDTLNGFVLATGVFTLLTAVSLYVAYAREKRIAIYASYAGIFVIVFGLATVYLNQPWVFMFEATAYNGVFALLLVPGLIKGRGDLKPFFTGLFDISDRGWFKLSVHYFILFLLIAAVNEIVWRNLSQEAWIIYKYIASASTIVLGFFEIPLGKKYRNESASGWGVRVTSRADEMPPSVI